jgi:hypothetical protein
MARDDELKVLALEAAERAVELSEMVRHGRRWRWPRGTWSSAGPA